MRKLAPERPVRLKGVLRLCSVCELDGAQCVNRRILYRQNEVQETQCSLFAIYSRLPKLAAVGSNPISRSIVLITYGKLEDFGKPFSR